MSAAFSAIMITAALALPSIRSDMTEASMARSPSTPDLELGIDDRRDCAPLARRDRAVGQHLRARPK
jgi:hypothetical protein